MSFGDLSLTLMWEIDRTCDRFEASWRASGGARIEDFLDSNLSEGQGALFNSLLLLDLELRRRIGEEPTIQEYLDRFPGKEGAIEEAFRHAPFTIAKADSTFLLIKESASAVASAVHPSEPGLGSTIAAEGEPAADDPAVTINLSQTGGWVGLPPGVVSAVNPSEPGLGTTIASEGEPAADGPAVTINVALTGGWVGSPPGDRDAYVSPLTFGRYRISRLLGQGGFGRVYLAEDDELERRVAVKVPRPGLLSTTKQYEAFIREARVAAGMKHHAIVTVHDIGRQGSDQIYVVMEYIEGKTLAALLRNDRPPLETLVRIVIEVATAIHYAHELGLVHRDLKPSNILIDRLGRPHVADFGLAVDTEMSHFRGSHIEGTPAYMSPEQIRGESHRFDRRTDIWAMGVILYEILAHQDPFVGATPDDILNSIITDDPPPPRRINESVPSELESICLKCLSKRMSDRYDQATELAADLRHWLAGEALPDSTGAIPGKPAAVGHAHVISRGLRPYNNEDASFFLSLVPGSRDRDGLPESIRFWKTRIEERSATGSFSVGLLYGPSGCGKSSLVRAGLLPRLSDRIEPIYIEATPTGIEPRLLARFRQEFRALTRATDLAEAFAALRKGDLLPAGRKVVLIIDQFEQWLHANSVDAKNELVRALRQCDGQKLQTLLLVRDDFWMAITRFMKLVEVPIVEGTNSAAVDLFDSGHARQVLIEFGRAFGQLPQAPAPVDPTASSFLDRAIAELSEDGQIIPVRLILFAEMIRRRPWKMETLQELGGIEGIGVKFLEESFSGESSPPSFRLHADAAQAVFAALLPSPQSILRGRSRTVRELEQASGYHARPDEFGDLMRILDTELRMVTPSDPTNISIYEHNEDTRDIGSSYQLTHDYLIRPLRQWLSEKQTETRAGRARTRLRLISAHWNVSPENRLLPSVLEWLGILHNTQKHRWSLDEKRMMRAASRHYLVRFGVSAAMLCVAVAAALWIRNEINGRMLFEQALKADYRVLPSLLADLDSHASTFNRHALEVERDPRSPARYREISSILLFRREPAPDRASFLRDRVLEAEPDELALLGAALAWHPEVARIDELESRLADPNTDPESRLRVGCVLARLAPETTDWSIAAPAVVHALIAQDRRKLSSWLDLLDPVLTRLVPSLEAACLDPGLEATTRVTAAEAVAEALGRGKDAARLVKIAVRADRQAFRPLANELRRINQTLRSVAPELEKVLAQDAQESAGELDKDLLAHRRANALLALLVVGEPDRVWTRLRHQGDPRLRALLIQRLADPVLNPGLLLERLRSPDDDPAILQAILMALAETDHEQLPNTLIGEIVNRSTSLFRDNRDPGVHSAAELLLGRLKDQTPIVPVSATLSPIRSAQGRAWFVGPNDHTFAVVTGPLIFAMGSPVAEEWHDASESLHYRRIDRSIAVATAEVTITQFRKCFPEHIQDKTFGGADPRSPANRVTWFQAATYCNWLSDREGLERCYADKVESGMVLDEKALERNGYRLPTEAEWEYLCRAGTSTSRPFGQTQELMPRYCWTWLNSDGRSQPVGRLLPNEYGLFDILGNMWEWCHDGPAERPGFSLYPSGTSVDHPAGDACVATTLTAGKSGRFTRGGAYDYAPSMARSARRYAALVDLDHAYLGFRVARTLPTPSPPH